MKYHVTIDERTFEVDLSEDVPRVDGDPIDARLERVGTTPVWHLQTGSESHPLLCIPGSRKGSWRISIGSRAVDVDVLDERSRMIREMSGVAEGVAEQVIAAPMPGLIVEVPVSPGQQIQAGDSVVVIEAMKMENELRASSDGVVARVEVRPGQAVEKGAILVVLE